ncbi:hypothetical protein HNQ57_001823 [Zhongshania antarctica]|uniref:Uncharacterized protein n=1 Tax=Zhongshania antarctica TaxID=641702 RepID=A0A840R4R6_9GAMM|nr:hypothetical protein [Zhongshania antarctica]MBB5187554.1 hypothetical protein [Zhongshania antarctica]
MKQIKRAAVAALLGWSVLGNAALVPAAVHLRDVETMLEFIRKHQYVAMGLESIDLLSLTVFYNNNCEAKFVRSKPSVLNLGRPGPQPGIVFERSTCPLTENNEASQ